MAARHDGRISGGLRREYVVIFGHLQTLEDQLPRHHSSLRQHFELSRARHQPFEARWPLEPEGRSTFVGWPFFSRFLKISRPEKRILCDV